MVVVMLKHGGQMKPQRFRKKPVIVEAIQYTEDAYSEIKMFMNTDGI